MHGYVVGTNPNWPWRGAGLGQVTNVSQCWHMETNNVTGSQVFTPVGTLPLNSVLCACGKRQENQEGTHSGSGRTCKLDTDVQQRYIWCAMFTAQFHQFYSEWVILSSADGKCEIAWMFYIKTLASPSCLVYPHHTYARTGGWRKALQSCFQQAALSDAR